MAKKGSTRKQSDRDPVIESECEEPIESELQSHEISNNECALCFGLYDMISPQQANCRENGCSAQG